MEDQEEPQVQSAGGEQRPTTPVAAGAEIPEGGPNRTDPIPAFDSKTQEELNLERGTPGLQGVDSELYRAMMAGDEQYILSRFAGNSDRRLSEAEALILMKTKEQEALHAYETLQAQEAQLAAVREQDDEERAVEASYSPFVQASDNSADTGDGRADSYGGYLGEDGCYYDRFGGHYDDYGYESRDGSYTSLTGSHYDATTGNITQADGTERAVPKDLQGKPDKKAIVKAEAAVVALDNRKEPNARPMTAEQKAAAAATEAGALGDTPQLPQANEEQQQVADQAVRIRKRKGKRLDATWTREELEAARAEVDAERKAHTKEYDDYEAVLAGKKDKPASDDERYQPVSKDQALSKIGHVHSLGTQTTTPPADPAASATEWYTDKNGGYWDEFGGYYDNKGGYWDTNGGYWDKNGGYTDKHDGYTWADGSYLDARNNYVDSGGNLWAADGTYYKAQPNIDYKAQLQEAERTGTPWVPPKGVTGDMFLPTDAPAPANAALVAQTPPAAPSPTPTYSYFMPNDPNAVGAPDSCTATPAFTKFSAFRDWLTGDKSVNDTKFCSPADLLVPAPVAPSLLTSSSATTLGASVADVGRRPIAAAPKIG